MIERKPSSSSWLGTATRAAALALALMACAVSCRSTPPNSLAFHNSSKWEKDIARFEAVDKTNPPPVNPILFVGSSSIRLWTNMARDFTGYTVANRGFGGSEIADLVDYADRIIVPYRPKQLIIYCGGNDINAGKAPEAVYGDFVALVEKVRRELPHVRIAYISSAPSPSRWKQVDKVRELNSRIRGYCGRNGLRFINIFPLVLGPDGLPQADLYQKDQLHFNAKGYAIWAEAVQPFLME